MTMMQQDVSGPYLDGPWPTVGGTKRIGNKEKKGGNDTNSLLIIKTTIWDIRINSLLYCEIMGENRVLMPVSRSVAAAMKPPSFGAGRSPAVSAAAAISSSRLPPSVTFEVIRMPTMYDVLCSGTLKNYRPLLDLDKFL